MIPQLDCLTTALPSSVPSSDLEHERDRSGLAEERQLASHPQEATVGAHRVHRRRAERDRCHASRPRRRSSGWMLALSSSPSGCMPPVPSRTRRDAASASSTMLVCAGSSPISSVACQAVTWIRRSCPRPCRGARAPGPHRERAVLGPERVRACRERHRRTLVVGSVTVSRSPVERDLAAERAQEPAHATAAPRSLCSSPSTIGAAPSVTGSSIDRGSLDHDARLDAAVARGRAHERGERRARLPRDRPARSLPCPFARLGGARELERVGLAQ